MIVAVAMTAVSMVAKETTMLLPLGEWTDWLRYLILPGFILFMWVFQRVRYRSG